MSALVRSKDKAAQLSSKYPNVRVVMGDLDSVDVIEEETKNADIVFSMFPASPISTETVTIQWHGRALS